MKMKKTQNKKSNGRLAAIRRAREVLQIEAQSILNLVDKINGDFSRAVDLIYGCKGRVIVPGIG